MIHVRRHSSQALALALVLIIAVACATTGLGKSIQAADLQKRLVEEAAVEFIKLHLKGDPRITDAVYAEAKTTYGKWAAAQSALAQSLATWQTVKSEPNEQRLTAALTQVKNSADVYLALVAKFVNLDALKAKIGG
jgi:hypothetical protein